MNRIIEETEEFLALRRCHNCGNDTPLYIARIANEKDQIIGTDSRAPRCVTCGAEGWEYNPKVNKYPRGTIQYNK
jgi:hypothetical protein